MDVQFFAACGSDLYSTYVRPWIDMMWVVFGQQWSGRRTSRRPEGRGSVVCLVEWNYIMFQRSNVRLWM